MGDGKVTEYSQFLVMTVAMLLRHIHAILEKQTSNYGSFKLRGTKPQFKAALTLYKLFLTTGGDGLDPQANWAIHCLFESLMCAAGINYRPINYPTDQAIFLWAFLSTQTYRIPSHVQGLLAAAKYCFRCIALQIARIQVQGDVDGPLLEKITSTLPNKTEFETHGNSASNDNISSCEEEAIEDVASDNRDPREALEWLNIHLNNVQNDNEGMK